MSKTIQILTKAKLQDTYWGKRIIKAEKRGSFTGYDFHLSGNWTTCACGKQDKRIPRKSDGCPVNHTLKILGERFDACAGYNEFEVAAKTLVKIEKLAKKILKNMVKQ